MSKKISFVDQRKRIIVDERIIEEEMPDKTVNQKPEFKLTEADLERLLHQGTEVEYMTTEPTSHKYKRAKKLAT